MSKSISGYYNGTKGSLAYNGSSKALRSHVNSWAEDKAKELSAKSKTQRERFNTATVVYDVSTGKYYSGQNRGIELDHSKKNPILFGDKNHKGILPEKSLNHLEVGNCAEIHAVNKALNDGAKLSNLKMYTIHTTKSSFGKAKVACENCTYALKGRIKENYTGWKE